MVVRPVFMFTLEKRINSCFTVCSDHEINQLIYVVYDQIVYEIRTNWMNDLDLD